MKGYHHLLFATDFSAASDQVGARAIELAQHYQARISLIHVVSAPDFIYAGDMMPPLEGYDLEGAMLDMARRELDQQAQRLGIPEAEQWVEVGSAKYEIVRLARERGVDLIIVGSHGRHGLSLLLGSTANGVLHGAHCDVLAIRVENDN